MDLQLVLQLINMVFILFVLVLQVLIMNNLKNYKRLMYESNRKHYLAYKQAVSENKHKAASQE